MATLLQLCENEALSKICVQLEVNELPFRCLYGFPRFVAWLRDDLPQLQTTCIGCQLSPLEQADALLAEFIVGKPLNYGRQFKCLMPVDRHVWELKTIDVRIFGWFAQMDCFVAVSGFHADHVKDHGLYPGLRDEVRRCREDLDLDEPKCIEGDQCDAVISVADQFKR